jgi:hypothetical protein
VRFEFLALRLEFRTHDALRFPAGKAANVLRGAFGMALDRLGQADFFAPRVTGGASGLADPPRPFVFRCRHLDGTTVPANGSFDFGMALFAMGARELVVQAFAEAAREGLGPGRGRAELLEYAAEPVTIELASRGDGPFRVRVDFLTPTELKHEGGLADRPEFPILLARLRDRISSLRGFYGPGPLEIDFASLAARSAAVRMTRCEIRRVGIERRSSRTGQTHPIGGFVGEADYEGPLEEFLPYLEAGRWTGVGRQAVWGKGEISVVRA